MYRVLIAIEIEIGSRDNGREIRNKVNRIKRAIIGIIEQTMEPWLTYCMKRDGRVTLAAQYKRRQLVQCS